MRVDRTARERTIVRRRNVIYTAAAAASFAAVGSALAVVPPPTTQPVTWDAGTGDYNTVTNWDPDLVNPPANADNQYLTINNGGTAEINGNAEGTWLILGQAPTQSGNLTINSGTVTLGEMRVGGRDFIPDNMLDWGIAFTANGGGTGVVVQNGGTVNVTFTHGTDPNSVPPNQNYEPPIQSLYLGDGGLTTGNTANGSYTIKNSAVLLSGIADNDSIIVGRGVGSIGAFTQQDTSSVTSSGFMIIGNNGATGTYTMSGGTLAVGTGTATLNQNLFVADGGSTNISPTNGTLTQTAGTITVKNDVSIGRRGGTGIYTITGASTSITAGQNMNVGSGGTGTMTMGTTGGSGPTVTSTNGFSVGISADPLVPGNGTFTIKSGSLIVGNGAGPIADVIAIGNDVNGTGTFNQEGGSVSSTDLLQMGRNNSNTNNVYNMTGGTLSAVRFFIGGGSGAIGGKGTFNLSTAGTVTSSGNFNIGSGSQVSPPFIADGTVNQSAGTISLTGTAANGILAVGNSGGVGVYSLSGGTLNNNSSGAETSIGRGGSTGTMTVSGTGVYNATSVQVGGGSVGGGSNGNGTLNVQGGTVSVSGTLTQVSAAAAQTRNVNVSGGIFGVGIWNNGTAGGTGGLVRQVNITGGTTTVSGVLTGGVNVTWNISAGTLSVAGASAFRNDSANPTIMNVSGTGDVKFSNTGTSLTLNASQLNITGGTFNARSVITNTGTVYISGGAVTIASGAFPGTFTLSSTSTLKSDNTISLASNILMGSATVNVASGSLSLTGPLTSSTAQTLTKTGPGALTISGTQSHVNNSALTASAGTLNVNSDGGTNLTINANSATNFGVTQHLKAINVGNNATATLTANGSRTIFTNTLGFTGNARLDLTDNDLVVKGMTYAAVEASVKSGFGNFDWLGTGITSSTAAAQAQIDGSLAVGVINNADWQHAMFGGETVSLTDILVKYTWVADANVDGLVDNDDFGQFLFGFSGSGPARWLNGDFDYDNDVDNDDFGWFLVGLGAFQASGNMQLSDSFKAELAAFASEQGIPLVLDPTPVPEPTTLGALGLAGAGMLARRRRR